MENKSINVLVTGGAGFVGFHLIRRLINLNYNIVIIDNLNNYYDPQLKFDRLAELGFEKNQLYAIVDGFASKMSTRNLIFEKIDISNRDSIDKIFVQYTFDIVINLAAQAGVRYSIDNPYSYVDSNLVGFVNILEKCRNTNVKHLIYASSSSVYGMNVKQPFSTSDRVDFPISLYAATKKSNELMAHAYSHLYGLPTTGLRFFTVYGPYGRPDMAYFTFTKNILNGVSIDVFNEGTMQRDFTYIDDIIEGIVKVMNNPPSITTGGFNNIDQNLQPGFTNAKAPYKIYNLGNNQPITLRRFISAIENSCKLKAKENKLPMQPGDVPLTFADIDDFAQELGYKPITTIENGIEKFVNWFRSYYNLK